MSSSLDDVFNLLGSTAGPTGGVRGGLPSSAEFKARYEVHAYLGGGGCGDVFLAQQKEPSRKVAIKTIRTGHASDGTIARFRAETQALARLDEHPGIARIYDARIDGEAATGTPYFVMEYVPSAEPLLKGAATLKLDRAQRVSLLERICDAVGHAHERAIIHRDLKPGNVLLTADGRPKVIDFGLARMTDSDMLSLGKQTQTGQLIGTCAYMSPEQTLGRTELLTPASDVYSLGVVAYELLLGRLPYAEAAAGVSVERLLPAIRESAPIRPRTIDPDFPIDLERILLKALHKDPARRYATAGGLRDALRRYLDGQPILDERDTLTYVACAQMRRLARRHGTLVALGAIAGAAALGGAVAMAAWPREVALSMQRRATPPFEANIGSFTRVVRVVHTDTTDARLRDAGLGSLVPPEGSPVRAYRAMDSALFEALAALGVRAVVADYFHTDPADAIKLKPGVMRLTSMGIGVAAGTTTWNKPGQEPPDVRDGVGMLPMRWGDVDLGDDPAEAQVDLLHKPEERMPTMRWRPGLAMAGYLATMQPLAGGEDWLESCDMLRGEAVVRQRRPDAAGGGWGPPRLIEFNPPALTPAAAGAPAQPVEGAVDALDYAVLGLEWPSTEEIDAATLDYADILARKDPRVLSVLRGKVVMVANEGAASAEDLTTLPGRAKPVSRSVVHAAALELLLRRHGFDEAGAMASAAVLAAGAWAGWWLGGRVRRRTVLPVGALAVCTVWAGALAALRWGHVYIDPVGPGAALVGAMVLRRLLPAGDLPGLRAAGASATSTGHSPSPAVIQGATP